MSMFPRAYRHATENRRVGAMIGLGLSFVVFLAIGVPIAFVLGLSGLTYFLVTDQTKFLLVLPKRMLAGMDQFALLAIPLFVLAGAIMDVGGLTRRLVGLANSAVGRFRGGLSLTAVWRAFLSGVVSGSAAAVAAGCLARRKPLQWRRSRRCWSPPISAPR
jgi:C4-dicarboxylate transporter, DctM subunit